MKRLTVKSQNGRWQLAGVSWEALCEGQTITKEVSEKLYGALCKLKAYEDSGLSPDEVRELDDFDKTQTAHLLKKLAEEQRRHCWASPEEPPDEGNYVLLSFANFTLPEIGRYEEDKNGDGAYYLGDEDETCISQDLYVNGWMPLPKTYRPGGENSGSREICEWCDEGYCAYYGSPEEQQEKETQWNCMGTVAEMQACGQVKK